jgi:hypothetical protein
LASSTDRTVLEAHGFAFVIRAADWLNAEGAQQAIHAIETWISRQPKDTVEALHASLLAYDNGTQNEEHRIDLRILWATIEHLARNVSSGKRAHARCSRFAVHLRRFTERHAVTQLLPSTFHAPSRDTCKK